MVEVFYNGERLEVPKEVADFLSQDARRERAEAKQDERRLSKMDVETALSCREPELHPLDNLVTRNLRLETLRKAVANLDADSQKLIHYRYDEELSLEAIGKLFGVSKMAISKRLSG